MSRTDLVYQAGLIFHEMAKLCRAMPRHYKLQLKVAELNHLWDIRPTPNGIVGVQQSLQKRLESRVQHLIQTTPLVHPLN